MVAGIGDLLATVEFLLLAARRMVAGTTVGIVDAVTLLRALAALAGAVLGAHALDRSVTASARAIQVRRLRPGADADSGRES